MRDCPCDSLYDGFEHGVYLKFYLEEKHPFTGYCHLSRENGNTIRYKYLLGHLTEEIEKYPGDFLCAETRYDTSGTLLLRNSYFPNGHLSGRMIVPRSEYNYESFYTNGRIQRKGGFSLIKTPYSFKDSIFFEDILFDSLWKPTGEFDSVFRYSPASINY